MIWLLAAALLFFAGSAEATIYYVGKSGSDSNGCPTAQSSTAGNRKLTIASGLGCLSGGDTLIIGDGVYNENIGPNTIPSGSGAGGEAAEATWSGATVIQAENSCTGLTTSTPTCTAIIRPSAAGNCWNSGTSVISLDGSNSSSYIIFQGLEVDANSVCVQVARFVSSSAAASPSHIRVKSSYFHDAFGAQGGTGLISLGAFSGQSTPDHIEVLDSVITNFNVAGNFPTQGGNHCLYWNANGTIRRNVIKNCSPADNNGQCIATHSGTGPYTVDISANDCSEFGYQGIEASNSLNTNIYNNTVHNGGDNSLCQGFGCAGIVAQGSGGATNTLIANNTVYNIRGGTDAAGILIQSSSMTTNTTIQNNIVYGTHDAITGSDGGTISNNRCASGCSTSADPQFVNAAANNFHLAAGSPMISAGTTIATVTTDKDGMARPASPSIGAYEGVASSVSFSDEFNRANNADLGSSWTPETGRAMQIVNNRVRPSVVNFGQEEIVMEVAPAADQYSRFLIQTFTSGGAYGDVGAIIRASDPSSARRFYICFAEKNYGPGTSEIGKQDGSTYTTLTISSTVTWAAGDQIECRAVGTTISLYRIPSGSTTPALVLSTTDSSISSGRIGMESRDDGAVSNIEMDNFNAGDYPPASTTFPDFPIAGDFPSVAVLDTFDRGDAANLGANWTVVSGGGFTIVSNVAVAPASATQNLYTAAQATSDHEVYATWDTIPACCGYTTLINFAGESASANSQYRLQINRVSGSNALAKVIKIDSGGNTTATPIAEVDLGGDIVDGNSFGIRVSGTTISAYWKYSDGVWYRIGQSAADATLPVTTVYGGISGATPAVVNDFGFGPFTPQTPPSPSSSVGSGRFGTTFPGVR